jgi:hypothetical protein
VTKSVSGLWLVVSGSFYLWNLRHLWMYRVLEGFKPDCADSSADYADHADEETDFKFQVSDFKTGNHKRETRNQKQQTTTSMLTKR